MIFDAHSDLLYAWIENKINNFDSDFQKERGAIINYFFKGSESHAHFLFVLNEIEKIKNKLPTYVFLGIEGLAPMESIEEVASLKKAGIRFVMLTWNEENKWATGALGERKRGLTHLGRKLLKKLAEEGFILDVSHLNETSFWEVLRLYKGKVFASHSCANALNENPRNLTDAQIVAIALKKGVIGVNAYAPFVGGKKDIESYVLHLEHIRDLVGIHVPCFGFDFDSYLGSSSTVSRLESYSDVEQVIEVMRKRGWKEDEIQAVSYKNIFRFLDL